MERTPRIAREARFGGGEVEYAVVVVVYCMVSGGMQVRICWEWVAYLQTQVPPGKDPLFVNLDETRCGRIPGRGKGNIVIS